MIPEADLQPLSGTATACKHAEDENVVSSSALLSPLPLRCCFTFSSDDVTSLVLLVLLLVYDFNQQSTSVGGYFQCLILLEIILISQSCFNCIRIDLCSI